MMDNLKIEAMACGTKTSLFQFGNETVPLMDFEQESKAVLSWTEKNNKFDCVPGALTKRGYLHLFRDVEGSKRDMLMVQRLDSEDISERTRLTLKRGEDAKWEVVQPEESKSSLDDTSTIQELLAKDLQVKREFLGNNDPLSKGWFFYS